MWNINTYPLLYTTTHQQKGELTRKKILSFFEKSYQLWKFHQMNRLGWMFYLYIVIRYNFVTHKRVDLKMFGWKQSFFSLWLLLFNRFSFFLCISFGDIWKCIEIYKRNVSPGRMYKKDTRRIEKFYNHVKSNFRFSTMFCWAKLTSILL